VRTLAKTAEGSDVVGLHRSSARIRAQVLRASARCDAKLYERALEDVGEILDLTTRAVNDDLIAQAYRVAADAYEGLGQYEQAIDAVRQWGAYSSGPSFSKTKVGNEIARLRQRQQQPDEESDGVHFS